MSVEAMEYGGSVDWDRYKTELYRLYIMENRSLADISKHMKEAYGLRASRGQCETQFHKWGYRKYMTKNEWMYIGRQLQKRERDGKPKSDVYFNDRHIPSKKVRKEVSRYYAPVGHRAWASIRDPSPMPPEAITIQTPKPSPKWDSSPPHIDEMQYGENGVVECLDTISRNENIQSNGLTLELNSNDILPQDSSTAVDRLPAFSMLGQDGSHWFDDILRTQLDSSTISHLNDSSLLEQLPLSRIVLHNLPWTQFQAAMEATVEPAGNQRLHGPFSALSQRKPVDILTEICRAREDWVSRECTSSVQSLLHVSWPERYNAVFPNESQVFHGVSQTGFLFQVFEFALYLISNALLSESQIDSFLEWLTEQKHEKVMMSYLPVRTPTMHAFTTKILASAARIGNPQLLRLLIDSGIDTSPLKGVHGGRLLQRAASRNDMDSALILIENGADVNVPVCYGYRESALKIAARTQQVKLVETLLKSGANANTKTIGSFPYDRHDPLSEALYLGNAAIVRLLIDAGVDLKSWEAEQEDTVQWSQLHGNDEVLQVLCIAKGLESALPSRDGVLRVARLGAKELSEYLRVRSGVGNAGTNKVVGSALFTAVSDVDMYATASLLEIGVHPNMGWQLHSVLSQALLSAEVDLIRMLLDSGADVNDAEVYNCLNLTPGGSGLDILRLLLEAGLDTELYGGDALANAACSGNIDAIKLLLAFGVDVDALWFEDLTALQMAAAEGEIASVNELLEAGANVNAPPALREEAHTALQEAALHGCESVVQILLHAGAEVNAPASRENSHTALQGAALNGHESVVQILLRAGANVNAPAALKAGHTAIQAAVKCGSVEIVKVLLEAGADVNGTGSPIYGQTALEEVLDTFCNRRKPHCHDIVRLLLEAGADPNATAHPEYEPPLQCAIILGDSQSAKLLLEAGADVKQQLQGEYQTHLQCAAAHGATSIVKALLEAGAPVNTGPSIEFGRTALQAAAFSEHPDIDIIELLLAAGAEVNAPAGKIGGVTALQGAAIRGYVTVALRLLDVGADVNAAPATFDGRTALDGAAEHGRLDMVKILLNAGATGNTPSPEEGITRFSGAIELARENGHFAVVRFLEDLS